MNFLSENIFNDINNNEIELLKKSSNLNFRVIKKEKYQCFEYDIKLNIFSFGKLFLPITITIVGLPISVCYKGYTGDITELIKDYKKQKKIFLILNTDELYDDIKTGKGKTLPTCIFNNKFDNFENYINTLRSSYRRRINIALEKGKTLEIKKIEKENITDDIYQLYLNIVKSSKYQLEILNKDFFKLFDSDIYVFYDSNKPLAFVQLKKTDNIMHFVFGGMDYKMRNKYDLYLNMLLFIVKTGIQEQCEIINFGQTAEYSKMTIGCTLQNKYMYAGSNNIIIDFILRKFMKFLEYKNKDYNLKVFKNEQ